MQLTKPIFERWQTGPILCLTAFILCLPSLEVPKSIFLWLFVVFGGIEIWKHKDQYRWQKDDSLIMAWMLSGFVVALFAGIHHKEWVGAKGSAILVLFFLVLRKLSLGQNLRWILGLVILVSTLLATGEGLWQLYVTKQIRLLELHSVGHVNHSAIYLVLNFALALAMALVLNKSDILAIKVFVIFCLLVTAGAIVVSNSRASIMTMVVIAVSFVVVWLKRSKWPLMLVTVAMMLAATGLYLAKAPVVQKHQHYASQASYLDARGPIWNSSLLAWRHFPWFGLGVRNFGQATQELQSEWLAEEGKTFEKGKYLPIAHPHNFYLSTLAEQGLFGFTITMLVIGRIGFLLYKNRPRRTDSNSYWCCWLSAFGAIEVVLVNGSFNTTLHHEHGLLALLLIGMWWGSLDQRLKD